MTARNGDLRVSSTVGHARRRVVRSPLVAALLSFLVPGLGQAWLGAWRRGLAFVAPLLILLLIAWALWSRSTAYLLGVLLQPPVLLALVALNLVFIGYRLFAIADAYQLARDQGGGRARIGRSQRHPANAAAFLAVLGLLVIGLHGALAYVSYATYDVVSGVFTSGGMGITPATSGSPTPTTGAPSGSPGSSASATESAPPTPTPSPTPESGPAWAADGRLDILLVGSDAGPGRWSLRTDTLILASVQTKTGRAALFGIPRNLVNVPLPQPAARAFRCGCFPDLINAIYVYAGDHPELFPGGDERGWQAVRGVVEELTGVHLDGIAAVDLNGFVALVDALGGLDITVPARIVDNAYPREDGRGEIRIVIEAGRQHMNGTQALRYARTRHQDDDYHRMRRQQQVLVALREQMNVCSLLPRIPELVDIAKRTLKTDFSPQDLPDLLELASLVDSDRIAKYAFNPPDIPEYLRPSDVEKIHKIVANAFRGPAPPVEEPPDEEGGAC